MSCATQAEKCWYTVFPCVKCKKKKAGYKEQLHQWKSSIRTCWIITQGRFLQRYIFVNRAQYQLTCVFVVCFVGLSFWWEKEVATTIFDFLMDASIIGVVICNRTYISCQYSISEMNYKLLRLNKITWSWLFLQKHFTQNIYSTHNQNKAITV